MSWRQAPECPVFALPRASTRVLSSAEDDSLQVHYRTDVNGSCPCDRLDRRAAAQELVERVAGLSVEDALATPFLALGTQEEIAEHFLACRGRWGSRTTPSASCRRLLQSSRHCGRSIRLWREDAGSARARADVVAREVLERKPWDLMRSLRPPGSASWSSSAERADSARWWPPRRGPRVAWTRGGRRQRARTRPLEPSRRSEIRRSEELGRFSSYGCCC